MSKIQTYHLMPASLLALAGQVCVSHYYKEEFQRATTLQLAKMVQGVSFYVVPDPEDEFVELFSSMVLETGSATDYGSDRL